MNLSLQQIAEALKVPWHNVEQYWPLIDNAFKALTKDYTDDVAVAALATLRVETETFQPVLEKGSNTYFLEHYWENEHVRHMLGNLSDVDALRYIGRGFIQCTGRNNYAHYGHEIGVNLLDHPNEAMEPNTAALIFVLYFREHGCTVAANARNWQRLRQLVNGGLNGYEEFLVYINKLETAMAQPPIAIDPEIAT